MYMTLIFLAILLLPVPIMARSMGKRQSPWRVVLEGVIAGAAGVLFLMILASVSGNSIFGTLMESVRVMADSMAKDPTIGKALGLELSQAERTELLKQIYERAAGLFPSTICILSAIIAYTEYILLSKIIKPNGAPALPMDRLRDFGLPRNAVIGWLILLGLSWLITREGAVKSDILYLNINTLFNFAFCLQGISVLFMYCYKKRAPKAIAVILTAFFLTAGFGKMVLLILGFADILFKLKKRLY